LHFGPVPAARGSARRHAAFMGREARERETMMKRRLQAAYAAVAMVTLAASAVLMAFEPKHLGAATHADWSATVDLSALGMVQADAGDTWGRIEQARLARRAAPRS
jgi:hypothetical protein